MYFKGDVAANLRIGGIDILSDFRSAVHDSNNVFNVMACENIATTASMKSLQLRGDKERRCYDLHRPCGDLPRLCCLDRSWIPAVGESEHVRVDWHHVNDDVLMTPPAERRAGRGVFSQSQGS